MSGTSRPMAAVALMLACAGAAPAAGDGWVQYAAPDHSFTAHLPVAPVQVQKEPVAVWSASAEPKKYSCVFGFSNTRFTWGKVPPQERKKRLGMFSSYILKRFKVRAAAPTEVSAGTGVDALQASGSLRGLPCQARFLAPAGGERIYFLLAFGSFDRARFLTGFKPGH